MSDIDRAGYDFDQYIKNPAPGGFAPYQHTPSGLWLHNPAKRRVRSGSEMASRLVQNATNGAQHWVDGMQNPSRSPTQAAKDAAGKWANNTTKAIQEKRFEKGLAKTSDAEIAQIATAVGAGGFSAGVQARTQKIEKAMNRLQPMLQAASDAAQGMPNDTEAAREARMVANLKNMRKIKGM